MNTNLLRKLRKKYRLVNTRDGYWLFEYRPFITNWLWRFFTRKKECEVWYQAFIGNSRHGHIHRTKDEALASFKMWIQSEYGGIGYKVKKAYKI